MVSLAIIVCLFWYLLYLTTNISSLVSFSTPSMFIAAEKHPTQTQYKLDVSFWKLMTVVIYFYWKRFICPCFIAEVHFSNFFTFSRNVKFFSWVFAVSRELSEVFLHNDTPKKFSFSHFVITRCPSFLQLSISLSRLIDVEQILEKH